jgi:hypothetical protein
VVVPGLEEFPDEAGVCEEQLGAVFLNTVQDLLLAPVVAVRILFPAFNRDESKETDPALLVMLAPFNVKLVTQLTADVPTLNVLKVPATAETLTELDAGLDVVTAQSTSPVVGLSRKLNPPPPPPLSPEHADNALASAVKAKVIRAYWTAIMGFIRRRYRAAPWTSEVQD